MINRLLLRVLLLMVLCIALVPFSPAQPAQAAGPALNGGGSSFAKNEIDQWRAEVARKPYELTINYVAQGSSFGRQQYLNGSFDFGASDIPFTAEELAVLNNTDRKDFVYVPVSAGGLGIMYNLIDVGGQQVRELNLYRRTVCRMFTEPNMRWDDPEIQQANPSLRLPAELIRPIVRQDGSGTSYVLSEYCIAVAPDVWAGFVQRQGGDPAADPAFTRGEPTSNWPVNWPGVSAALAADGVAAAVADPATGRYSVTYNESGFAKLRGFPNASVQNAAGVFAQPTEEAVTIALGYASPNGNGTFRLAYEGPAPEAYFPSTYSYVIAQTNGFPADKGEVLARFLCYAVTKGQRLELTSKLGYARLSAELVAIARESIVQIPGAPPWDQCAVADAPPPPPAPTTAPPGQTVPTAPGASVPGGGGGGGPSTTGAPGAAGGGGSGARTTATSLVIDPVTGSSIAVFIDPETGETISVDGSGNASCDPSTDPTCVAPVGGGGVGVGNGGAIAAPAAPNPPIDTSSVSPEATKIAWWLLQGAAVCALGVALAGARRRTT
jgi:phosphate transport system substrate-binding protein